MAWSAFSEQLQGLCAQASTAADSKFVPLAVPRPLLRLAFAEEQQLHAQYRAGEFSAPVPTGSLDEAAAALDRQSALHAPESAVMEGRELRSRAAGLRHALAAMAASAAKYSGSARSATVASRAEAEEEAMDAARAEAVAQLADEQRELQRSAARLDDVRAQVAHARADAEDGADVEGKVAAATSRASAASEAASALEESIDRLQQGLLDLHSVLASLGAGGGDGAGPATKAPRLSASSKASGASGASGASVERLTLQAERTRLAEELAAVTAQTAAATASHAAAAAKAEALRDCQRRLGTAARLREEAQARAAAGRAAAALHARVAAAAIASGLAAGSPAAALLAALAAAGGQLPNNDKAGVVAAMNAVGEGAGLGAGHFSVGSMIKARTACFGKTLQRDTASNTIVSLVPPPPPPA